MRFYCLADIRQPFTQGDFLVPSFRAVTENISNSEKMQRTCATTLIFIFSKSTNIHQSKNGIYSKPFNSQLKEIKGQTVYHFENISLAIKRIAFLYLLISCTFRRVLSIIS